MNQPTISEPELMSEEEIDAVFRAVSVDLGWAVHKGQIQMLCRAALRANGLDRENRELREAIEAAVVHLAATGHGGLSGGACRQCQATAILRAALAEGDAKS